MGLDCRGSGRDRRRARMNDGHGNERENGQYRAWGVEELHC